MKMIWTIATSHLTMAGGTNILTTMMNRHTRTLHHLMMAGSGITRLTVLAAFLKYQRDPGDVYKGWSAMMICLQQCSRELSVNSGSAVSAPSLL